MIVPVFIKRVTVLSAVLSAAAFLFLSVYYQFPFALAFLMGGLWSSLNLLALTFIVQQLLRPTPIDWPTALASIFIKLPLLYGAGFLLVTWDYLPKLGLVAGFSIVFAVIILKGLGRMLLRLDEKDTPHPLTPSPSFGFAQDKHSREGERDSSAAELPHNHKVFDEWNKEGNLISGEPKRA